MKSNILLLFAALVLIPNISFAKDGDDLKKPNLSECKPLEPKFEEIQKAGLVSDKWGRAFEEAVEAKETFKTTCADVKARPNAPGNIAKFRREKDKVQYKFEELKKFAKKAQEQFKKVYKPMKELGAKDCHDKLKRGFEIVEVQTKKEIELLGEACKDGPLNNAASR